MVIPLCCGRPGLSKPYGVVAGICGNARLSIRSVAATLTFMFTGSLTAILTQTSRVVAQHTVVSHAAAEPPRRCPRPPRFRLGRASPAPANRPRPRARARPSQEPAPWYLLPPPLPNLTLYAVMGAFLLVVVASNLGERSAEGVPRQARPPPPHPTPPPHPAAAAAAAAAA